MLCAASTKSTNRTSRSTWVPSLADIPAHTAGDPLVMFPTVGPPYNSGVFIRVNIQKVGDSVRNSVMRRRASKTESAAMTALVQPVRVCVACELYLSAVTESVNPFAVFLTGDENAPVLDIDAMNSECGDD